MVIVPYIRHNAVHTAQCRMPYEICRTGARILSIASRTGVHILPDNHRYTYCNVDKNKQTNKKKTKQNKTKQKLIFYQLLQVQTYKYLETDYIFLLHHTYLFPVCNYLFVSSHVRFLMHLSLLTYRRFWLLFTYLFVFWLLSLLSLLFFVFVCFLSVLFLNMRIKDLTFYQVKVTCSLQQDVMHLKVWYLEVKHLGDASP